jgi:hypothetical protein
LMLSNSALVLRNVFISFASCPFRACK